MSKTMAISLSSLVIGLALGVFVIPVQVNTYVLDSTFETLSDTVLSSEQGAFFLTTAVIELLEKNEYDEAMEILELSQQSHVNELIREYSEANNTWKEEINSTFTSFVERRQAIGSFDPVTNETDRIVNEHVEKYNNAPQPTQ